MNRLLALAACVFVLGVPRSAEAATLFTGPVIFIKPTVLNFGPVPDKMTVTNTFLVENMGSGKLVGKATVQAPFKIISGGDYTLRAKEAQIITVTYTPSGAPSDTQTVTFTGGGGSKATVNGKLATPSTKKSKRK
jgi:hypothetical protein